MYFTAANLVVFSLPESEKKEGKQNAVWFTSDCLDLALFIRLLSDDSSVLALHQNIITAGKNLTLIILKGYRRWLLGSMLSHIPFIRFLYELIDIRSLSFLEFQIWSCVN